MKSWCRIFLAGGSLLATLGVATSVGASTSAGATAASQSVAIGALPKLAVQPMSRAERSSGGNAKLDATLIRLIQESKVVSGTTAVNRFSTEFPHATFASAAATGEPLVYVNIVSSSGDPRALAGKLAMMGIQTRGIFRNAITAALPISQASAVGALSGVAFVHTPMSRTRGLDPIPPTVLSEGDFTQRSIQVKNPLLYQAPAAAGSTAAPTGLTGNNVTVGVMSDSFNCAAVASAGTFATDANQDAVLGNLPSTVVGGKTVSAVNVVLEGPCPATDEGRALAQIVYQVAPGTNLAFASVDYGNVEFANAIINLALPTTTAGPLSNYSSMPTTANPSAACTVQTINGAGVQVEDDDVGYFDEPVYQEGVIGQAIDMVATGSATYLVPDGKCDFTTAPNYGYNTVTTSFTPVPYFSSAGNTSNNAYENTAPVFYDGAPGGKPIPAGQPNAGEKLLNFDFDGVGSHAFLPMSLPVGGGAFAVTLFWDQPFLTGALDAFGDTPANGAGAANTLDICLADANGNVSTTGKVGNVVLINPNTGAPETSGCVGASALNGDPFNALYLANTDATAGDPPAAVSVVVGLAQGPTPGRIKVIVNDDGAGNAITSYFTGSATIVGHPASANAMAVAASPWFASPACEGLQAAAPEIFTSFGGQAQLFDGNGNALAAPFIPNKPDVMAPDRTATTFFGGNDAIDLAAPLLQTAQAQQYCIYPSAYPYDFGGTSAAAPHAAGVAALMLQAVPTATPTQIYSAMRSTALPNTPGQFSYQTGYGYLQADAALSVLVPPTLTVSPTSIAFNVAPNAAAQQSTVTVSNAGQGQITLSNFAVVNAASLFSQTNNCTSPLTPGQSCAITVTFASAPKTGVDSATVTFDSSVAADASAPTAHSVALTATVQSPDTGGGGGSIGWLGTLLLAGASAARRVRARKPTDRI